MDLGIIGNCQYSALIDRQARVAWLCWPRFDSSFVFGSLLDEKKGGEFSISMEAEHTLHQQYVRNTNILRTEFKSDQGSFEVIDFAPRFQHLHRIFHPTMLIRIVRPLSGEPKIKVNLKPTYDYGKTTPKSYWGSNHIQYEGLPSPLRLTTNSPLTYLQEEKSFVLSSTRYFVLTWGEPLEAPLKETCENFYERTKEYWQTWVKRCAIPPAYQDEVIRSALVLKLHQYEDTGAIIAATTTSIPESPHSERTWDYRYCWLRDSYFTLSALRYLGQFEEMEAFIDFLRNIAEASDGQSLQPVYGVNGERVLTEMTLDYLEGYKKNKPVRVGNAAYAHVQNDIYGEMILAISPLFLDRRFNLEDVNPPKKLLFNLVNQIERYVEVEDAGLWEFRNKKKLHTFSLLMHWLGANKANEIAQIYHMQDLGQKSENLSQKIRNIIETKCWNEELQCFTQAAGTKEMDASLFMLINTGFITKEHPAAHAQMAALEKSLVTANNLAYRYVHTDDFGKPTTAFTVCSFWYVEALARLGQYEKARNIFEKYIQLRNHLGLLTEDIDPQTLEQWGNFPQTYSHVGLINAAFRIAKW